jgi:hypothetical protein
MNMQFQKNGHEYTFESTSEQISARPALGGALITLVAKGRSTQYGAGRQILVGSLQFGAFSSQAVWPRFEYIQSGYQPQFSATIDAHLVFEGLVTYDQLEAFEASRRGGPLQISIGAQLLVLATDGSVENWSINSGHLIVPEQNWVQALSAGGFRDYVIQVMSFPRKDEATGDRAKSLLFSAKSHFDQGQYKQCIVELRSVFEVLTKSRQDDKAIKSAAGEFQGSQKLMTLDDRMFMIRYTVQHATHLAAHPIENREYSRAEAKALLACTCAMLELYVESDGIRPA